MLPDLKKAGKMKDDFLQRIQQFYEDVPKCSGREIFEIFQGNIGFPGNAIRERRLYSISTFMPGQGLLLNENFYLTFSIVQLQVCS